MTGTLDFSVFSAVVGHAYRYATLQVEGLTDLLVGLDETYPVCRLLRENHRQNQHAEDEKISHRIM